MVSISERNCFKRILELICSVFDAYSVVLFFRDTGDNYQLSYFFSLGDDIRKDTSIHPGQGLVGWIIRNNQPLLVNNFERYKDSLGYYNKEGESKIKAFMGCPIENGLGVVCLDSKRTYSFGTKDQKILHQFVQLIETVYKEIYYRDYTEQEHGFYVCMQIIHSLRKKHPRWSTFLHHFLQILSEYTGFAYCFFAARDELGNGYFIEGANRPLTSRKELENKMFNIGSGLIGWVFRNHSLISTEDKDSKAMGAPVFGKEFDSPQWHTVICLPLVVHTRTRGVLVLANKDQVTISENMKRFLYMTTDQLALFLENLYLKNRLRQKENAESKEQ